MNKTELIQELTIFANEMKAMLAVGKSLREICQWSYAQRESGRNIPYMEVSQTVKEGRGTKIVGLWAAPTKKQTELRAFFEEVAPGLISLSRFKLTVYLEDGVIFQERLGKEKSDVRSLLVKEQPVEEIAVRVQAAAVSGEKTENTQYRVTSDGFSGFFSPDRYSKYYERLEMRDRNELPAGEEVYGLEQAVAHAREIHARADKNVKYYVKVITETCTRIPVATEDNQIGITISASQVDGPWNTEPF